MTANFPKIVPHIEGECIAAQCSICGNSYEINTNWNAREGHLCGHCGASGRSQAIAHLVATEIFQRKIPLEKIKPRKDIKIIGLSDGRIYADILSKIANYTNSFFHQEPFLDITAPPAKWENEFDGLISADVFEHVIGEPSAAFAGAFKIIKPGGCLILTVPFINEGPYIEHYPGITGYTSEQRDGKWIAHIQYSDNRMVTDYTPRFHGGPGKTLEVRLFNRARIEEELIRAGFVDIKFYDANIPEFGVNWSRPSRPITARKPRQA